MKKIIAAVVFSSVIVPAFAQKPCDELKSEIAAKFEAKGVKNYRLESLPADQVKEEKVVGSCEGGSKKIIYKKG